MIVMIVSIIANSCDSDEGKYYFEDRDGMIVEKVFHLHLNESEARGLPRHPDVRDASNLLERILNVEPEHSQSYYYSPKLFFISINVSSSLLP